ncbi:hypothetical protein [Streptomyces sp. NPDC093109]|uniref:hypothetical protein n=1 Tax=Streptomyces sp. NPDC093109 TaxID=3154977 RepID=UPI00344F1A06
MKFRKSLTALVAAAALAAPLGLGASEAVAGTVAEAAAAPVASAAADNLPVYRDWYWTYGNCVGAGQQGVDRGHWDRYQCASGDVYWHLWTNR